VTPYTGDPMADRDDYELLNAADPSFAWDLPRNVAMAASRGTRPGTPAGDLDQAMTGGLAHQAATAAAARLTPDHMLPQPQPPMRTMMFRQPQPPMRTMMFRQERPAGLDTRDPGGLDLPLGAHPSVMIPPRTDYDTRPGRERAADLSVEISSRWGIPVNSDVEVALMRLIDSGAIVPTDPDFAVLLSKYITANSEKE